MPDGGGGDRADGSRDGGIFLLSRLDLNGVPVRFVVDTGASEVVLSARDAARIGIDPKT